MAFKPIQYEDGQTVMLPVAASQTFVKGDATQWSGGYLTTAAATNQLAVTHVIMEAVGTSTSVGDKHLFIRTPGVVFEADTSADTSRAICGTFLDLGAAGSIDTTASDDDLFFAENYTGATTDRKVIGWFVHAAPNVN